MKVSKSMLAVGTVTTLAVASLAGLGVASAHGSNGNRTGNPEQKMEQRQEQRTERLQTLVAEGKLSEEQRLALEAKHEEMHELRDQLRSQDLSRELMHEQMEQAHEGFEAWATEQGIDLEEIRPEGAPGQGHRGGMNRGGQN